MTAKLLSVHGPAVRNESFPSTPVAERSVVCWGETDQAMQTVNTIRFVDATGITGWPIFWPTGLSHGREYDGVA
jgi:hypothetical protein